VQAPPVETRDGLAWADRYVQSRPGLRKAFSWLLEMHRGVKAAEIAAREGSREDTVLRAVSRLREQLRTAYKALLLLVAIGSLTWALVWKHGVDDTAKPGPKPTPTVVAPEGPAPAPSQAPEPTASDLRTKAFDECAAHDWNACLADLDLARSIDPAGEADPAVKAAREAATDGLGGKPRAR